MNTLNTITLKSISVNIWYVYVNAMLSIENNISIHNISYNYPYNIASHIYYQFISCIAYFKKNGNLVILSILLLKMGGNFMLIVMLTMPTAIKRMLRVTQKAHTGGYILWS